MCTTQRHDRFSNNTQRNTQRKARRIGSRFEALEGRRMMFGDGVPGIDLIPLDTEIQLHPTEPLTVDAAGDDCIDFEDLAPVASYGVGDTFVADNSGLQAKISGEGFEWGNGIVTLLGIAEVGHANLAGHLGQEMAVNNILLNFDFGGTVSNLRMRFGEYGGNLNLDINGDFRNFEDFQDIHGLVIGGTSVTVPAGGLGSDVGVLDISGNINSFKVGGQELWIDHICVGEVDQSQYDWGDAPDEPYPTLAAHQGAHHVIDPNVFLGKRVEPEANGQPTFASDGDDLIGGATVDDEDGVRFLTPLVPGSPAKVEVIASTDGWLNAWIDFDRNGSWSSGPADNIFSAQPLNAGVNILSFVVPADSEPGPNRPTYSRWRFSTTDRVLRPEQPDDHVPNGEVEDHLVFIQEGEPQDRLDYGDAPDKPYATKLASDGARHLINPEVHLGKRIDADLDGQPSFLANGDDTHDADDEDGVRFLTPLVPGHDAKVEILASIDGHLDAWIDFDQDGNWSPAEQIAVSELMVVGSNTFDFVVPPEAIPHPTRPTYARFRFSLEGGLKPEGWAPDGEVEDYMILNGDLNDDGHVTADDIDQLCELIHAGDGKADLNGDGVVDDGDMDYLIHEILGTHYGDANLDGIFDSNDLIKILAAHEYEDGIPHNSTWAEGDFNCDEEFTADDLIKALADGGYVAAAVPAPLPVTEAEVEPDVAQNSSPVANTTPSTSPQERRYDKHLAKATDTVFGDKPHVDPWTANAIENSLEFESI